MLGFGSVGSIPGSLMVSFWYIPGSYCWKLTYFHSHRLRYAGNILLVDSGDFQSYYLVAIWSWNAFRGFVVSFDLFRVYFIDN